MWSDLDGGEGALAAAVAEDPVEVERVQVAPHRAAASFLPPSLSPPHWTPNEEISVMAWPSDFSFFVLLFLRFLYLPWVGEAVDEERG